MTRQKAKQTFKNFGKSFTLDEARQDINILIDKIYDEHDSQVCKNCKLMSTTYYPGRNSCRAMGGMKVKLSFGCNHFERKL